MTGIETRPDDTTGKVDATDAGGWLVAVVGPSGAGKDTLIRGAMASLRADSRFVFARRIITRSPDGTEDHDSVTQAGFDSLKSQGALLISWNANGLSYGIPANLGVDLRKGRIVVANISRAALPEVRQRFGRHHIVLVTAEPEVLAARLNARAREDAAAQQARLDRARQLQATVDADTTIDNSRDVERSLAAFTRVLQGLAETAATRN